MNLKAKEWDENNREQRRAIARKSAAKHKAKTVIATVKYQEAHPQKYLYYSASSRAKKTGVLFSIIPEDIKIPKICPVFKQPFKRGTEYSMSLDRIDSAKGYTKDNIQVISRLANTMKSSATKEQLKQFAKWILDE